VSLRAGPRLRTVAPEMPREILRLKEQVTGGWKKSHTEGLNEFNVHSSPNIIREMKTKEKYAWGPRLLSESKNSYRFLTR